MDDSSKLTMFQIVFSLILIAMFVAAVFSFGDITINPSEDLTEAEVARMDSVQARIQQAPERSFIEAEFPNDQIVYIDVITGIGENSIVSQKFGEAPYPKKLSDNEYLLSIRRITYPGDEKYDSLRVEYFRTIY